MKSKKKEESQSRILVLDAIQFIMGLSALIFKRFDPHTVCERGQIAGKYFQFRAVVREPV